MKLRLSSFLDYKHIVIQCHDNPDADALASGYALCYYLHKNDIPVRFIYSGKYQIKKSNLLLMIKSLSIPIEYVTALDMPDLLIMVDCQYGESNVTAFAAKNIAVIDHHQLSTNLLPLSDIRSSYGSCSTIMYKLLEAEGSNINDEQNLATALYYGLLTDTNFFTEVRHPADKDLRDSAKYNNALITQFRNCNLTMEELLIAGDALKGTYFNSDHNYATVLSKPCDPNILGIISDMVLEVDRVQVAIAYTILEFGIKLSVRSCTPLVQACEIIDYITQDIGGGGGHLQKAGGFIQRDLVEKIIEVYSENSVAAFIQSKLNHYFESTSIIYAKDYQADLASMQRYTKKSLTMGYLPSSLLADENTRIIVRTLEGDVDIQVKKDVYIIIGINGEIYPCKKEVFEKSYIPSNKSYSFSGEYSPTIIQTDTGNRLDLLSHAMECTSTGKNTIFAKAIDKRVKVFTSWDPDRYYLGKAGDYLAVRQDNLKDVYVIAKQIFENTYSITK